MRMGWMNGRWRVGGYIGIHRPKGRSSSILTDIATGWTECLPLLHHGQDVVLLALTGQVSYFPFLSWAWTPIMEVSSSRPH